MFLRLLQQRPILAPHGGMVVGSARSCGRLVRGDVDDGPVACGARRGVQHHRRHARREPLHHDAGGDRRYPGGRALRARRRPARAQHARRTCRLRPSVQVRHHAMFTPAKAERLLGGARGRRGVRPSAHLRVVSGEGWDCLDGPLADPVWKSSWDFEGEARRRSGWPMAHAPFESPQPSDAELWRGVEATVRNVLLPSLTTTGRAPWPRAAGGPGR